MPWKNRWWNNLKYCSCGNSSGRCFILKLLLSIYFLSMNCVHSTSSSNVLFLVNVTHSWCHFLVFQNCITSCYLPSVLFFVTIPLRVLFILAPKMCSQLSAANLGWNILGPRYVVNNHFELGPVETQFI